MCDGSFNVLEAAQAAGVKKVVAASSASIYGLADTFPTTRGPPPLQQPHLVRREQDHARGPAALVQRHVRPALRGAALLQRLRPAHGHPRQVHRSADPLDGAHRRRPAAADPRRRQDDDGLRLHRGRRPRQHPGARVRRDRRRVQRRQRHRDQPQRSRRRAAARDGLASSSPSTAPSARSTRCRAASPDTKKAARDARLPLDQSASRKACARLVDWWRANKDRMAA